MADAEVRLAKQKKEFDDALKDYYEKTLNAEKLAADWEARFRKSDEERNKLKSQAEDYAAEVKGLSTQLDGLKREKEEKVKERKAKSEKTKDHDDHIKSLQDELANLLSELEDEQAEKKKLQEQNDDYEAQRIGLHEEIDDLKKTRDDAFGASDENTEARNALVEVNATFEQMFKELGEGLSMDEYIDHIRNLQRTSSLRRDDSQASMVSDFGNPQAGRSGRRSDRQVSRASMADELNGLQSEQESDDDLEDQDATVNGGKQFSKWHIKHGNEPQSVRNPAVYGDLENVGVDELFEEWEHKRTQTPGDGLFAVGTTTAEAGTPMETPQQPWHVTHGEEPQSVRNPALPGQVEIVGEDDLFGEWEHKRTQTPADNIVGSPPPAQQQKLSFSGIMPGASTFPILPLTQPPVPVAAQVESDTVKSLRAQLGQQKMLLETRDKDRNNFAKSNQKLMQEKKELQEKLSTVDSEMQALRQSRAPAPAPAPLPPPPIQQASAVNQTLGFSGTHNVANFPPVAAPQAVITPAVNQNLGFSGMHNLANFPLVAPPQVPITLAVNQNLGFSGMQNVANFPPVAPPQAVNRPAVTQNLGFSGMHSVANIPPQAVTTSARPPVAPPTRRARNATTQTPAQQLAPPQVVHLYRIPGTVRELPYWLQLLLGLLVAALAYCIVRLVQEKYFWLSANNQTHEELVRLTGPSSRYGWLVDLEEWMGIDRQSALLG
ncbi:hypothetical protein LTR36_003984 [Oleoguttula mirabilis]|uniref:Uncharacterized protein n=1 Tax=Oleoguttula mirabilis TaxID=1507867 RepID=A0AAV9JI75_9PEZI|nr:hypothetical protein LTR36_003984 [Oleoguttula mirabilis]